jgi:hypothetical protein
MEDGMRTDEVWQALEGTRVGMQLTACLRCGSRDGVLRRHHCKHELELYCDWCEEWTGHRISYAEVRAWVETMQSAMVPTTRPLAQFQVELPEVVQGCPV